MENNIIITKYGENDFDAYFVNSDCSVRGTKHDILQEIKEYIDTIGKDEQDNITIIRP